MLIMNIELESGSKAKLVVRLLDDVDGLVDAFCLQYGLSDKIKRQLKQNVEKNKQQVIEEHKSTSQRQHNNYFGKGRAPRREPSPESPQYEEEQEENPKKGTEKQQNYGNHEIEEEDEDAEDRQDNHNYHSEVLSPRYEEDQLYQSSQGEVRENRQNHEKEVLLENIQQSLASLSKALYDNAQTVQPIGNKPSAAMSRLSNGAEKSIKLSEELRKVKNSATQSPMNTDYGQGMKITVTRHEQPTKQPIHNKLYQEGLMKKEMKERRILQKEIKEAEQLRSQRIGNSKKYSENIVNRLYYEGLGHEESKKLKYEKLKSLEAIEASKEYTHHPNLSKISKIIVDHSEGRRGKKIEDVLIEKGLRRRALNEQALMMKQNEEMNQLQSKPTIGEISEQLAIEKMRVEGLDHLPRHDQLYEDSIARRNKSIIVQESQVSDQCTFRPTINQTSEEIVNLRHEGADVLQRFSNYERDKGVRLQMRKAMLNPNLVDMINPETNLPFFHPLTGRSPANRTTDESDVGNYLYNLSFLREQKLEEKREVQYKVAPKEALKESSDMVRSKKVKIFREIFNLLDGNSDGVISSDKVSIESLSNELLKLVSPLLVNMEELQMEIDEPTFIVGMEEIYKKLSLPQRNLLLHDQKKSYVDHNCTFKPKLNAISLKLAQNKRRIEDTVHPQVGKSQVSSSKKGKYFRIGDGEEEEEIEIEESSVKQDGQEEGKGPERYEELNGLTFTFKPRLNIYKAEGASHYIN